MKTTVLKRLSGEYVIYRSEGLWWAKKNGVAVDAAPTKAQLIRSLEQSH